jgi:hypothetical protein
MPTTMSRAAASFNSHREWVHVSRRIKFENCAGLGKTPERIANHSTFNPNSGINSQIPGFQWLTPIREKTPVGTAPAPTQGC